MAHSNKTTKEFGRNKCDSCEAVCAGIVLAGSVAAAIFNDNAFTYIASAFLAVPAADTVLKNISFGKQSSSQPA